MTSIKSGVFLCKLPEFNSFANKIHRMTVVQDPMDTNAINDTFHIVVKEF